MIKRVSQEEQRARMEICRGCPHFQERLKRCKKCGCLLQVKTRLKNGKCPIDKW